jgi:hypothetical protein
MMKRLYLAAALFASVLVGGYALAQVGAYTGKLGPVAPTPVLHQSDLVQVSPYGVGTAAPYYATPGQFGSMLYYQTFTPLTAFTITPGNQYTMAFLNPAGTLATGTLTLPAAPFDGENFCLLDTQTQTAITVSANTGQSIVGTAVTALVAGTSYCWRYMAPTSTWYRTQ